MKRNMIPGSTRSERAAATRDLLDRIPQVLVPAAVLLIPTTTRVIDARGILLSEITLIMLLLVLIVSLRHFRIERRPAQIAGWLLPVAMLIALIASPSSRGMTLTFGAACGAGLVLATKSWDQKEIAQRVAVPLLVAASLQALIIAAQSLTDEAVGLTLLWPDAELRVIDGLLRAQGMMTHVYEPTALAALAAGVALAVPPHSRGYRWLWIVGAGSAGAAIGLTHSRSALLSLLLVMVFVIIGVRRGDGHLREVGSALLVGFVVAAALTSSAWLHRAEHTTAGDLDEASLGRITLIKQGVEMISDHPVFGVGPGRYLPVLRESYEIDERYPYPVHSMPLFLAAENGIAAGVAITMLTILAIGRAIKSGPRGAALGVAILGFLVFDTLHFNTTVGLLMLATWLAVLQHHDSQVTTSRRVRSE